MTIKVEKRDKSIDVYDPQKIINVVLQTGLSQNKAQILSSKITKWLNDNNLTQVTSLQIRDRVLIEIQKIDKTAAKQFIAYEKYKDKNYGVNY